MSGAPIVITLEIFPADAKSKRKLIVSGAPKGEMPVVLSGLFAERHTLLDQLWIALGTRKPQVVKVKTAAKKGEKKDGEADEAEKDAGDEKTAGESSADAEAPVEQSEPPTEPETEVEIIPPVEAQTEDDQLVAGKPLEDIAAEVVEKMQLPLIEGDTDG